MKEGPSLLVSGELWANGHWHISVWLHQRPDGIWRVGRATDSEIYVLNHVFASVPARCGPYRAATKTERRELLRQVYEFIDRETGCGSTTQITPGPKQIHKENNTMPIMRCAIYTKHGKGPQCPKQAAIGKDICGTHFFLEAKLGSLPRGPVAEAPVPATPEPVAIMRTTTDTVTEAAFAETAPVEVPTAPVEAPAEEKKGRKRTKKAKTTPKV
jgi:hypothetical protein